jgi:hypothetical protein
MAFLNKKEQTVVNAINVNEKLTPLKKSELINTIRYNARLRQDRYRPGVKVFLSALSTHQTNKVFKTL